MSITEVHSFIRDEVERQGFDLGTVEGLLRVSCMSLAWDYARAASGIRTRPMTEDLLTLAELVEPACNARGFRQTPVFIYEGWKPTVDWRSVPESVEALVEHGEELTPLEFYTEFELIHPFRDGNGRVGAIIYNWMNGSMYAPEAPADLFTVTGRLVTGPNLQDIPDPRNISNPAFDMRWLREPVDWAEVAKQAMNYPIQGADEEVGYIVEPDVGKHACADDDCRSCHNCGITGVSISGPWNLCEVCDNEYTGGERIIEEEEGC